jgi:Calcineurin-like phosphoesterase
VRQYCRFNGNILAKNCLWTVVTLSILVGMLRHLRRPTLCNYTPASQIFCTYSPVRTIVPSVSAAFTAVHSTLLRKSLSRNRAVREFHSHSDASTEEAPSRFISYITDVEGDREYLERYVRDSRVLCWKDESSLPQDQKQRPHNFPYDHHIDFQHFTGSKHPRDFLVFGGDIWDQGGSDLYVIRQLLDLRRRYPQNVFFVMGNRDINKMRIVEELGPAGTNDNLPEHPGVYWLNGTGRMGDPKLGLMPNDSAADRLRWMLNYTMGSPRAFEYRRWELQAEGDNRTIVSDHDVVESYRQSCDPVTGEISHYLRHAHLMLRLGEVAFVHGALPFTSVNLLQCDKSTSLWDDLSFAMPWLEAGVSARDVEVHSIDDWIVALNEFASSRIDAWISSSNGNSGDIWAVQGGYHLPPSFSSYHGQLLQYGMGRIGPHRALNPTVVYNRWGIAGKPRKIFRHDPHCEQDASYVRHTRDFFERTGIRLICSGHQPTGEMPCHVRIDDTSNNRTSWIISGDTSYTGDTKWLNLPGDPVQRQNIGRGKIKSGRGPNAVSEILIELCAKSGGILDVHCHGTFSDGTKYRSQSLKFDCKHFTSGDPDRLVVGTLASGKHVPSASESPHGGPWWTQAALDDGSILLAAGEGFNFWTRMIKHSYWL